ncbi:hypothetical protein MSAN_00821800 [Mycena sanguinolenta]|uniref:F-box domain-containing protein n=1 Tax=Mycena sanguinolenta TaxID=230812 RepID=A0A8H7DAR6_9AGAR|nr:hypothetical protein MSAN_00821800 [Mycena sanguinolenta]
MSVCSSWLKIVDSTPSMWSYVYVHSHFAVDRITDVIVNRTAAADLYIHIRLQNVEFDLAKTWMLLDSLNDHYQRCVYLVAETRVPHDSEILIEYFSGHAGLSLRHLVLDVSPVSLECQREDHLSGMPLPILFKNFAPLLQSFSLARCFVLWNSPSFYKNLRHLSVSYLMQDRPTLPEWLSMLGSMDALISLDLRHVRCLYDSHQHQQSKTVELPCLTHLRLDTRDLSMCQVIRHLHLPALHTFVCTAITCDFMNELVNTCETLLSQITSAEIRIHHTVPQSESDTVSRLFGSFQNVRRLDLRHVPNTHIDTFWSLAKLATFPQLQWIVASIDRPSDQELLTFWIGCTGLSVAADGRGLLPQNSTIGDNPRDIQLLIPKKTEDFRALSLVKRSHSRGQAGTFRESWHSAPMDFWMERPE